MQTCSPQDTFLPHVENGTITLIGATTENPSFQLNNALLSRCRVIVLEKLSTEHVEQILKHALDRMGVFTTKRDSLDTNQVHLSSEYRWGVWNIWELWYCLWSLVLICCQDTCNLVAGTSWDEVPIWEQKWPATLVIPVFMAGIPAKLTWIQLCRHASGKAMWWLLLTAAQVLIHPNSIPGSTGKWSKNRQINQTFVLLPAEI